MHKKIAERPIIHFVQGSPADQIKQLCMNFKF